MQVILDSSFARPGSAPIWGGKKVEFRDWTKPRPEEQTPCHSSFSAGIICGPHRGSFAVHIGDHLRFGIICGPIWGSIPVLGSFAVGDHLRCCTVP